MSRFETPRRVLRFWKESLKQYAIDQEQYRKAHPYAEIFWDRNTTDLQRAAEKLGKVLRAYDQWKERDKS